MGRHVRDYSIPRLTIVVCNGVLSLNIPEIWKLYGTRPLAILYLHTRSLDTMLVFPTHMP